MIRPWEDTASELLSMRDEVGVWSWKYAALTEAIDCVRQAAVLENDLNARISELEEHIEILEKLNG